MLGPSWGILAPSWGHHGASWAIVGPCWADLGASHLGASWRLLGAIMGHLGLSWGILWKGEGGWGRLGKSRRPRSGYRLLVLSLPLFRYLAALGPPWGAQNLQDTSEVGPKWQWIGAIGATLLGFSCVALSGPWAPILASLGHSWGHAPLGRSWQRLGHLGALRVCKK